MEHFRSALKAGQNKTESVIVLDEPVPNCFQRFAHFLEHMEIPLSCKVFDAASRGKVLDNNAEDTGRTWYEDQWQW